jgi:hypothetical protein
VQAGVSGAFSASALEHFRQAGNEVLVCELNWYATFPCDILHTYMHMLLLALRRLLSLETEVAELDARKLLPVSIGKAREGDNHDDHCRLEREEDVHGDVQ